MSAGATLIASNAAEPGRTLVLLEGRRLVPADGLGQVDLNVLAPELIESVDVVTGGASGLGAATAAALAKNGTKVFAFDLPASIEGAPSVEGVEYVLHQAAIPSVPRSVEDPLTSNRANIDATLSVLVAARDAGVKRVVYAGSSSAYGNAAALPKQEDMPTAPLSPGN